MVRLCYLVILRRILPLKQSFLSSGKELLESKEGLARERLQTNAPRRELLTSSHTLAGERHPPFIVSRLIFLLCHGHGPTFSPLRGSCYTANAMPLTPWTDREHDLLVARLLDDKRGENILGGNGPNEVYGDHAKLSVDGIGVPVQTSGKD